MINVRIFDKEFAHAKSYSGDHVPKHINWVREGVPHGTPAFYTNRCLREVREDSSGWGLKVAWLSEPPSMMPESYEEIEYLEPFFHRILTYDQRLLAKDGKYLYCPIGGSWVPDDLIVPPKTKLVSMISSDKLGCPAYELRHQIADALSHKLELFGQIVGKPIRCKTEGLAPFMFSVVVENDRIDDYFTEKLIDCLLCKTVAFYWGTPRIARHFNPMSMIPFDSISDLENKINRLACEGYYDMNIKGIEYNAEKAKEFRCVENWLWNNYPFLFQ